MKTNATPIPVRSVVCLPRWLFVPAVLLCSACLLGGLGLAVYGVFTAEGHQLGGYVGGGLGSAIGAAGGLFGTLRDWRRRLPAPALLWHLQHDAPTPFYRRVFWPALVVFVLGLCLAVVWNHRVVWHGIVQVGGMLAFISGTIEAIRRHTTTQARALFALYADGALDAEDTAAIDDARKKDAAFDAQVREWQAIDERVRQLLGS